jgi:hypothetical protein
MNIVKLFNETLQETESNNRYRDMTRKLDETVQETENVGRLASLSRIILQNLMVMSEVCLEQ